MPNKRRPHKRGLLTRASRGSRTRAHLASEPGKPGPSRAHSVKDLLARAVPVLSQVVDRNARQAFWRPWLEAHLAPGLATRITAISERDGQLVVSAESPVWSARLRYALQELETSIRSVSPDIHKVIVRVLPRTTSSAV